MTPFFASEFIASRAAEHGVTVEQLHGNDRCQRLTAIRANIARELRARRMSFPRIGALMKRDHTTIIHYMRRAV